MQALFLTVGVLLNLSSLISDRVRATRQRNSIVGIRSKTLDRESQLHVVEQLGTKRSKTPEGFLLCEDVPIARTGMMLYGPGEVPIKVGVDGIARVTRDAVALFDPRTLASLNGKAVVDEHPDVDVTPANWRKLAVGIVLNARRGEGDDSDVILADLLITERQAIEDVNAGKREVSMGYEADYEQTGDGEGRQTNIIGNHVALVVKGRCGPRCAIGDHQPPSLKEKSTMGTKDITAPPRKKIPEAVRRLFRDAAEALAEEDATGLGNGNGGTMSNDTGLPEDGSSMSVSGDDGDSHTHIHIHTGGAAPAAADAGGDPASDFAPAPDDGGAGGDDPIEARFQAIEGTLAQIMQMLQGGGEEDPAPDAGADDPAPDDGDPAPDAGAEPMPEPTRDGMRTNDSAALETSFTNTISDAEVLVPGFRAPTFDAAVSRKTTLDTMCALRKSVLDNFMATAEGRDIVAEVAGDPKFSAKTADCATTAVIFRASAAAKRLKNNAASVTRDARAVPTSAAPAAGAGPIRSIADLNAFHRKHYAGK